MRPIAQILMGYHHDPRFGHGGERRKTHRFEALAILDRAGPRAACCEVCRREHTLNTRANQWGCVRRDCLSRGRALRGGSALHVTSKALVMRALLDMAAEDDDD